MPTWCNLFGIEPLQAYVVDTTAGGELEFTAVWTPTVYNIEYELAGGYYTYDVTNPTTYTVESGTFRLANPQKDNYVFLGWIRSGDKSLELQKNYTVRKGSSGDLKLYAVFQWKDEESGDEDFDFLQLLQLLFSSEEE